MTNLDHIQSLIHHGAQLRGEGGTLMPLTEAFYHKAVEGCHTGGYNAATYDLVLPGIDSELLAGHLERWPRRFRQTQKHLRLPCPLRRTGRPQRGLRASFA